MIDWAAVRSRGSALATVALAALVAACGVRSLRAQTSASVPIVLDVPGSTRAVGLNGAAVALLGDAGAVFSGPTGIATVSHVALEGSARLTPNRGYLASGALAWRLRQFDLGFGGHLFDLGDRPDLYLPVAQGASVQEALASGSLVYRYGLIAAGVSGKYARRKVDGTYQRAVSADAGMAIAVFDIMAIAFSVQNVGGNWRTDSPLTLPRRTRLGFTMNYTDPQETYRLLTTVEMQWREGRSSRVMVGGEAGVVVKGVGVVGRIGYASRPDAIATSHFSYGGSLHVAALKFDYAYRGADLLGDPAHFVGLRLSL